jgi:hypothetical protein
MDLLTSTGPWLYPLVAVGLCLLGAVLRAAMVIRSMDDKLPAAGAPHHAVIVWGVLGGVVGLLGTVIGFGRVAVGARAVTGSERAELEAMLSVMWEGVMVIVTPVTLGLWLFTGSLVAWLVLQFMVNRKLS